MTLFFLQIPSGNVSEADWDRLQYYSRKVKVFDAICDDDPKVHPSTYLRIAQLLSRSSDSALFPSLRHLHYYLDATSTSGSYIFLFQSPFLYSLKLFNISGFENTIAGPFLATLSSESQMLSRIVLNSGQLSVDIFRKSIVHFRQLRSLELLDAVSMSDFALWEALGTLPSLANFTLKALDPASYPAHAPKNLNRQSGSSEYFEALESLCVTGPFFLIQHLLDFIDSAYLTSINITIHPLINHVCNKLEPEDPFTSSMTIVASTASGHNL